jgi:tRNA nucleotidyltransferase/poly(A) polymerase
MLAMDVVTEEIVDPTGEAIPDVDAKVVRTVADPEDVVTANPLSLVDAIFLASEFGFSIDAGLVEAASKAELSDPDVNAVWATIRSAGKGKTLAVAEEYGMGEVLARLMETRTNEAVSKEVCHASSD